MLIKGKVWKYGNDINTDVIKISNIKYDGIVKSTNHVIVC